LSLRGVVSPSLLIHGGVGLDCIGGHTGAAAKPLESGVYDSDGVGYFSGVRGSRVPCSGVGIHRGVRGVLRERILCAITTISPLSAAVLRPEASSLDPLGDLTYVGFHDPVLGLYGD
jgi:hypothetical protein